MEIHELNTKALTDPAYVPFDDGTDTYKAEFNEVVENAANAAVAEADLTNNPVAFTSGDAASPTAWSDVSVITTGSTLATLFNRISTMVKNVRWLYSRLGTTDISSIGGGTVTGAISALNGKLLKYKDVTIPSITIKATGYIELHNYFPTGMNDFKFAVIQAWSATSPTSGIFISGDGLWLGGAGNTTITNLKIRYWYTD